MRQQPAQTKAPWTRSCRVENPCGTPPGPTSAPDGGRWMPESLIAALDELEDTFEKAKADPEFTAQIAELYRHYSGPALAADRGKAFAEHAGGRGSISSAKTSTTPARTRSTTRSARRLLAQRMGKTPRHRRDRRRAARRRHRHGLRPLRPGVRRLHGRGGHPPPGAQRLQHEAARRRGPPGHERLADPPRRHQRGLPRLDEHRRDHALLLGSVVGPHPFPRIVRDFQIGHRRETRAQILEQIGRLPDAVVACVGGGSNAAGMFYPFLDDTAVQAGRRRGRRATASRPATTPPPSASAGPACCTAATATCCRTTTARPATSHSISAGLDYPGVGPEHTYWSDTGRVQLRAHRPTARPGRVRAALPHRGHHPGHRILARPGRGHQGRPRLAAEDGGRVRQDRDRQPLRPRRQGRGHRR